MTTDFDTETVEVQRKGLVEVDKKLFGKKYFIHDRYSMVMFRVFDSEGYPVTDFDLILTGEKNNPNALPTGFFADRQCNNVNKSTVTYFFNYDVLHGRQQVVSGDLKLDALPGMKQLGLIIRPRPDNGFSRYLPCEIVASKELFEKAFQPNATTMIDIELQRVVSSEVFRFEPLANENKGPDKDFRKTDPGTDIVK